MTFTREPLQVVEIVQPLCSRTFGTAPCNATGSRCWNTDATCVFRTALDLTASITLRFVHPVSHRAPDPAGDYILAESGLDLLDETDITLETEGDMVAFNAATAIPALMGVSTAPTVLNVAAGNDDISPLGLRAVAEVAIKDFPFNDAGVDPYLATRAYDPMSLGSFWSKWLARNPFHSGYVLRIYDGYVGDALGQMIKREYSIEKIDASRSQVRITAKDILRRITDNNLSAPALSNGALSLDLTIGGTSFQAAGAVVGDYPSTGWVRINSEVIAYTSRATVGANVEFTGLTRGALDTTAAAHRQFDRVQTVLSYIDRPFQRIIYDLLTDLGGIPEAYIDRDAWDAEKKEWRDLFNFTAYITDPVEIQQLVGEICQQAQANIWWDERTQKIILRAQRPNFSPATITQEGNIIADSFIVEEVPKDRAAIVKVYYGLRNPTLSMTDQFSFRAAEAFIDVDKIAQYGGEAPEKKIFCRWISTAVLARALGGAYLIRFRDVRRHVSFAVTANDIANFWTGDIALIRHFLVVNPDGSEKVQQWLITSAETVEQGGVYRFIAEDNGSAGLLWQWVADTETRTSLEIGGWVDGAGTDGAGNVLPYAWV
jgi:hypothetical protein